MAKVRESLSMRREMFYSQIRMLAKAGWDERDYKLWSQVRQLPSYGLLSGKDNCMVSSLAVIKLLRDAAEERFKEAGRDGKG